MPPATAPAGQAAGQGEDNRRAANRVPIELKVEYRRLNAFFSDYIKNISKGGTFIKTKRPLQIGTEFVFRLSIPQLTVPLELRGLVVWIQHEGDPPRPGAPRDPGMGIRFVFQEESERSAVEQVVEQLMYENLGPALHDKLLGK